MRKLMLLLFLGLALLTLGACGGASKLKPESASDSAVTPGKLEYATGTFALTQGGQVTQPYECLLSADTYEGDGKWRGIEAELMPLSELTEKLPTVELDATLGFEMSDNAGR